MSNLINQLIEFRTIYLKAVARAAVNLEFRQELTNPDRDPLVLLRESFGYECPWDLTLVLRDSADQGPRLDPGNGSVMTQPYTGEWITIYIPNRPDGDPTVLLESLAAYYYENAWFLRDRTRDPKPPPSPVSPTHGSSGWSSVDSLRIRTNRFDLGDCSDDFLAFGAALFNAVALAWNNAMFMDLLTQKVTQPKQTITLLNEWLEYKYPWEFELSVEVDDKAHYDRATQKWHIKPPLLMLTLPWMTGAKTDEQEVASNNERPGVAIIGLALYNTDGPGYPFTCG